MATINQVTLTISGNTGSIEFHTRQDGGIWATFDVAQTSRTQNPQTGQWEDGATTWIRCTASGYLAEHLQHSMLPTGPDGKQEQTVGVFEQAILGAYHPLGVKSAADITRWDSKD